MSRVQDRRIFQACAVVFFGCSVFSISLAAGLRGWVVGAPVNGNPTILCTTDGANWFDQGIGSVPAINLSSVTVSHDWNKVWVAGYTHEGYAAIYHSSDGGATWTRQGDADTLPDNDLFKIRAVDENVIWAVGDKGVVVRTVDGGVTWQTLQIPESYDLLESLQGVTAVDENTAWVGGEHLDSSAALFRTTDGGQTWTEQHVGGQMAHVLGLHAVDADTVWGIGGPFQIISTADGGASWETKFDEGGLLDGNEIFVDVKGTVWAAADHTVYSSFDGGETWPPEHQHITAFACMGINSPDGANVWAVSTGRFVTDDAIIYHSPDAGVTWNEQMTLPGGLFGDVAFVPITPQAVINDYDGDGKTDPAIYNEGTGDWRILLSGSGYTPASLEGFGGAGRQPVSGDFDGDGKTDPAIYNEGTGGWRVFLSGSGYAPASLEGFGGPGWQPVSGDFDGDGKTDLAIYEEATGTWRVLLSGNGYTEASLAGFGGPGWQPVSGDFDGDGKADLGIYEEATGTWRVLLSGNGYTEASLAGFGGPGWQPVSGDFDGDGKTDPAIYNEGTGGWRVFLSGSGYAPASLEGFGGPGWQPVSGDFDGDGKTDLAIYEEATGTWSVLLSGSGYGEASLAGFGGPGYVPVTP